MPYWKELVATRELLGNLTMREVKGQYRRTVFGQLWSLFNPIATMLVYSLVFGIFFPARPAPGDPSGLDIYPLWLMSVMLPWSYFTGVVNQGLGSIVSNAGLIKKVYFPRMQLPFSVALSNGITWALEMGVLVIALVIFGGMPLPWLPLVLVMMVLLAIFGVGLALLLSILNVHFRDTRHFVSILLRLWMYLTPIIYPLGRVLKATKDHPWMYELYELNPMVHFANAFRDLLYDNTWPDAIDFVWCAVCAGGVFVIGYFVFSRSERRLAELL